MMMMMMMCTSIGCEKYWRECEKFRYNILGYYQRKEDIMNRGVKDSTQEF
jgi:hypothetical protein